MGGEVGRVAWVTGGSAGIGRAIVSRLRADGVMVGIADAAPPDDDVPWIHAQLGTPDAAVAVAAGLSDLVGPADILVNNAGVVASGEIPDLSDADWDHVLAVNLSAPFHLLREAVPHMRERRWGRIVCISSGAAVRVQRGRAAYAASKAGLIALTKVAALENAAYGVTANVVAPGLVNTDMTRSALGGAEKLAELVRDSPIANPMGEIIEPGDIASAVAFLTSDESKHLTGQVLHVSAGSIMP